jgi:hypothetical protein
MARGRSRSATFQAGHASSILVTRSAAKRLVSGTLGRAVNNVATRYLKFQAGHVVPFSYRDDKLPCHTFLDGPVHYS